MKPKIRARTMWVLAALVVAYALFNVMVYYTTNSFGPIWFAISLAVYSAMLTLSLVLAFTDTGTEEPARAYEARSRPAAREAPRPE